MQHILVKLIKQIDKEWELLFIIIIEFIKDFGWMI